MPVGSYLSLGRFAQVVWADSWVVGVGATDDLGASISTLVYLLSDTPLEGMWGAFNLAHRSPPHTPPSHNDGNLEDIRSIPRGVAAISEHTEVPPERLAHHQSLITAGRKGFKVLREILSAVHDITRVGQFSMAWRARME